LSQRNRWKFDIGLVKSLGSDELSNSVGFEFSTDSAHFGVINLNLRYIDNE
jgi:hypothetical protein